MASRKTKGKLSRIGAASGLPLPDSAEGLDSEVRGLVASMDKEALRLGDLLREVQRTEGWAPLGFQTFDEYLKHRFDRRRRWAQLVIRAAEKMEELPLLREKASVLGPSKTRLLADAATPETEEAWIERGVSSTFRDLKAAVTSCRDNGGAEKGKVDPGAEKTTTTYFSLYTGQSETVERALEIAARSTNSEKRGHNLEMIAAEFLTVYGTEEEDEAVVFRARLREVIDHLATQDEKAVLRVLEAAGWDIGGIEGSKVPDGALVAWRG